MARKIYLQQLQQHFIAQLLYKEENGFNLRFNPTDKYLK